jgi:CDP-diacylglycerol--serine O-phosphatidyltransferase
MRNQIPNLFTLGNLLAGLLVIISSFNQDYERAGLYALIALVLDFMDGALARWLQTESSIGKELDSLADLISFGAAPALLLFNFYSEIEGLENWNYVCLILAAASAYRLAVFNIQPQSKEYFKGLPTPAMSIMAFSIPLAADTSTWNYDILSSIWFMISFVALGSFAMLSQYKLISLNPGSNNRFLNRIRFALLLIAVLLFWLFSFFGLILCLIIYIVISLSFQNRIEKNGL